LTQKAVIIDLCLYKQIQFYKQANIFIAILY
jgi:hypothetical protein